MHGSRPGSVAESSTGPSPGPVATSATMVSGVPTPPTRPTGTSTATVPKSMPPKVSGHRPRGPPVPSPATPATPFAMPPSTPLGTTATAFMPRGLFQLHARVGPLLLPSSQRTGEPTSGPAWRIALPYQRALSPATGRKESASCHLCNHKGQSCQQSQKQPCAQVGMVLTMQELRGRKHDRVARTHSVDQVAHSLLSRCLYQISRSLRNMS